MSQYCKDCYKQLVDSSAEVILTTEDVTCENCGNIGPYVSGTYPTMTVAECQVETQRHIETVRKYIRFFIDKLDLRGVKHDASKLESPEVECFAELTPKLATATYNSEEYQQFLDKLKPALDHHYASNRHHPEHFVNGVTDMTLIDILEMFCDWKASSLRQNDGNLLKSIDVNAERFHMDGQLRQILINTARMLDEHE